MMRRQNEPKLHPSTRDENVWLSLPGEVHVLQLSIELEAGVHRLDPVLGQVQPLDHGIERDGDDLQVRLLGTLGQPLEVVAVAEVGAEGLGQAVAQDEG